MSTKKGIWIDHSKAVIVSLDQQKEVVSVIESKVGKKVRLSGGSRTKVPYGPQDIVHEGRRYRKYLNHLKDYYERVCRHVSDAEALYVFGPGEAKQEFRKHIENQKRFVPPVIEVEACDKMTRAQIAAKVRSHFKEEVKKAPKP